MNTEQLSDKTVSFKGCHACFWLFGVCSPILCTILWSLNALLVIWLLRFCFSLCIPEKRKSSTDSSRSNARSSQDGGSSESTTLLTPIPFTPFYVESLV
uniref:Transmembrane protein n=1 Tax=Caenorhabditis tropicalis TaxID=1561998 RepID=A0A1I7V1Y5_9PELO